MFRLLEIIILNFIVVNLNIDLTLQSAIKPAKSFVSFWKLFASEKNFFCKGVA